MLQGGGQTTNRGESPAGIAAERKEAISPQIVARGGRGGSLEDSARGGGGSFKDSARGRGLLGGIRRGGEETAAKEASYVR